MENSTNETTLHAQLLEDLHDALQGSSDTTAAFAGLFIAGMAYHNEHPEDEAAAWYLDQIDEILDTQGDPKTLKALTLDLAQHIAAQQKAAPATT